MAQGELAGKVALVTGAGRNIGRAIALALAAAGARVGVNVRSNVAEAQTVVDEIVAAGGAALLLKADVVKRAEVDAAVRDLTSRFGGLDILVNNAAVRDEGDFHSLPYAKWREAFDVTLDGAFHSTQASFEWLKRSGAGSVVNIGGISNVTWLPPGRKTVGFDCGPGNVLLDGWARRHLGATHRCGRRLLLCAHRSAEGRG